MITYSEEALEYISKLSSGGMRDAITLMDKCLSYSAELTMENVIKALGIADYDTMIDLETYFTENESDNVIKCIESVHNSGKDLKQFIKQMIQFVLDIKKYMILGNFDYLQIPNTEEMREVLNSLYGDEYYERRIGDLLSVLIQINSTIKWESSPKYIIEAMLLEEIENGRSK